MNVTAGGAQPLLAALQVSQAGTRDLTEMYLGIAASAISTMSLIISGLHCACRRRAASFDWDIRFQRSRQVTEGKKVETPPPPPPSPCCGHCGAPSEHAAASPRAPAVPPTRGGEGDPPRAIESA
jgi:hypothetical protein